MPYRICKICNKKFYVKPCHIKQGWGKYCSINCRSKANLNGKKVKCKNCGKIIYRSNSALKKSKNKIYFCSKSCHCIWENKNKRIGKNAPNWKYGQNAYKQILIRHNVIIRCAKCGINDKRVLEVHHIDKNRNNNSTYNLIWLCRNCHAIEHSK